MPGAVTLRQAKAAHKARGGTAVSDKEIRQLQREIQLDRRAWAAKERDKSRVKTAQTRAEEQRRIKIEQSSLQLGTQRRRDRFGNKSSQFHLGAFFTKASELPRPAGQPLEVVQEVGSTDDAFGDDVDGLDDETLLSALQDIDGNVRSNACEMVGDEYGLEVLGTEPGAELALNMDEQVDWDEFLESATQISRELDAGEDIVCIAPDVQPQQSQRTSFGSSYSFGLTSQDIEALDPTPVVVPVHDVARTSHDTEADRRLMPPPTMLLKRQSLPHLHTTRKSAIPGSYTHTDQAEFSLTQLENFVDDGMTLSQL